MKMSKTFHGHLLILCLSLPICVLADDDRFTVSSCIGNLIGDVELGGSCNFTCKVIELQDGEVLAISKSHVYYTITTIEAPAEQRDIFVDNALTQPVEATQRYIIAEKTPTEVTVEFTDAIPGDSGAYYCHIRRDGENQASSRFVTILVQGAEISPSFAMKKSEEGREIVEVFKNNTSVNLTTSEYRRTVFTVDINGLLTNQPISIINVHNGDEQKTFTLGWIKPDVTNYTPNEVIPTDSHYTEMCEGFEMEMKKGDELKMDGRFKHYDTTYTAFLNVHILDDGNDGFASRPSIFLTWLSLTFVYVFFHEI